MCYNLACFQARKGERKAALDRLADAVERGFYAPRKIAHDSDLDSLRDSPRFAEILGVARARAAEFSADDVVTGASQKGEAYTLHLRAWKLYEENKYDEALKLVEEAYQMAPNDSRILYDLACFHALKGHDERAVGFLEKSVQAGFYCPRHIERDPDLESLRDNKRYDRALALARAKGGRAGRRPGGGLGATGAARRRSGDRRRRHD